MEYILKQEGNDGPSSIEVCIVIYNVKHIKPIILTKKQMQPPEYLEDFPSFSLVTYLFTWYNIYLNMD